MKQSFCTTFPLSCIFSWIVKVYSEVNVTTFFGFGILCKKACNKILTFFNKFLVLSVLLLTILRTWPTNTSLGWETSTTSLNVVQVLYLSKCTSLECILGRSVGGILGVRDCKIVTFCLTKICAYLMIFRTEKT